MCAYAVHVVANVLVCGSTIHVQFMYYNGYLQQKSTIFELESVG
jgi:hypothetical protein